MILPYILLCIILLYPPSRFPPTLYIYKQPSIHLWHPPRIYDRDAKRYYDNFWILFLSSSLVTWYYWYSWINYISTTSNTRSFKMHLGLRIKGLTLYFAYMQSKFSRCFYTLLYKVRIENAWFYTWRVKLGSYSLTVKGLLPVELKLKKIS